jgi:hypothetical protein
MFSSHNRDYQYFGEPYWYRDLAFDLTSIKNLTSHLFFLPRRLRRKRLQVFTDEYAMVNEADHRYSLLLYYIGIEKQVRQLEKTGFVEIRAFNAEGIEVESDSESFWIYYLTPKK